MIEIATYTFQVAGREDIEVASNEQGAAMQIANCLVGSLPQGCWMETGKENTFRWAEGNFFD